MQLLHGKEAKTLSSWILYSVFLMCSFLNISLSWVQCLSLSINLEESVELCFIGNNPEYFFLVLLFLAHCIFHHCYLLIFAYKWAIRRNHTHAHRLADTLSDCIISNANFYLLIAKCKLLFPPFTNVSIIAL